MAAVMMVGVWLLFNQHCFAAGDVDGKVRIPLMDPLTRRSALEKNFMRFGRSWKSNDDRRDAFSSLLQFAPADDSIEVETVAPSSLRLKSSLNPDKNRDYGYDKGLTSVVKFDQALDNFIRLEKTPSIELKRTYPIQDEIERDARGSDNFMRFGRGDNFMRFGREKDNNFMRFGRSDPGPRFARSIDIGREARDKNLVRLGRQRQADKGDGFIRFGRRLIKRSLKDSDDREYHSSDNTRSSPFCVQPTMLTDPNLLVAPGVLWLPEVFHKPPPNQDFIRLG